MRIVCIIPGTLSEKICDTNEEIMDDLPTYSSPMSRIVISRTMAGGKWTVTKKNL